MRICYLGDGGSIHVVKWANYFAQNGHEVHLASYRFEKGYEKKIHLHSLAEATQRVLKLSRTKESRWKSCTRKLVRYSKVNAFLPFVFAGHVKISGFHSFLRDLQPDVLHAHYVTDYGFLGAVTGFHPFALTAWGSDILIDPEQSKVARWIVRHSLASADLTTCDAGILREKILNLGVSPRRVAQINHGVDTTQFRPGLENEALRNELQITGCPVVISTRNFLPIYDVQTLIRSIPLVLNELPRTKFIVAGTGEQEQSIRSLARTLGVASSVRFVGWIPHSTLPSYLGLADVYVSTSLSDTTSVSLIEAMACSLAPAITDVGGNKEWIKEGENGYLIPVKAPRILANRICLLLEDDEMRANMGRLNRKIVLQRADYSTEMQKMGKLYENLVNRAIRVSSYSMNPNKRDVEVS